MMSVMGTPSTTIDHAATHLASHGATVTEVNAYDSGREAICLLARRRACRYVVRSWVGGRIAPERCITSRADTLGWLGPSIRAPTARRSTMARTIPML